MDAVNRLISSLIVGGVIYLDFGGPKTWDYRTQKERFETLGEDEHRMIDPEPCAYGGVHEFLTLFSEESVLELLGNCEILALISQQVPSDFGDGAPMELISVFGRKISP